MRRRLVAGNWKMNGNRAALAEVRALLDSFIEPGCDILMCPPATLIAEMAALTQGSAISVGGQDCHPKSAGAHTGNISADMLADAGASAVILGHSERRSEHGESDLLVLAKAEAALKAGLTALVCVGETEAERDQGATLEVIGSQLSGSVPDTVTASGLVIAYEPVWAIGTGRTPTVNQIAEVHHFLRAELVNRFGSVGSEIRLLYGGSVKPSNAAEIFGVPDVDGALVGGASLKAIDFAAIISALTG